MFTPVVGGKSRAVPLPPPGIDPADHETALLVDVLRGQGRVTGRNVLDVCTSTGALAIVAARAGASSVTAVDLSRRSAATARLNVRLSRTGVDVLCGDLLEPVRGRRFDVIVANPPSIPADEHELARHRKIRAGDTGKDGRLVLDRLLYGLPDVLTHDGQVLIAQSEVCGIRATLDALAAQRMDADVVARVSVPLRPELRARATQLEERGLLVPGQEHEDILVIEGRLAGRRRPPPRSRVEVTGEGPVLVHGTVEVTMPDGTVIRSDRAVTALCTCKRSRCLPFCDTSHRDRRSLEDS